MKFSQLLNILQWLLEDFGAFFCKDFITIQVVISSERNAY